MNKAAKVFLVIVGGIAGLLGFLAGVFFFIRGFFLALWMIVGTVSSIIQAKATWAGFTKELLYVLAAYGVFTAGKVITEHISSALKMEEDKHKTKVLCPKCGYNEQVVVVYGNTGVKSDDPRNIDDIRDDEWYRDSDYLRFECPRCHEVTDARKWWPDSCQS